MAAPASTAINVSEILGRVTRASSRPRYTFMVLNLLSEAADAAGKAGPYVGEGIAARPVRDWLCDALLPVAERDHRRRALLAEVRAELCGALPQDEAEAERCVAEAARERLRTSGLTSVSRAVSDLVRAGLVRRYYAGYRRNHRNRGGHRQAVYVVDGEALAALRRGTMLV